ncbi:hypothetical protein [Paraburkholderia sp.]|jgi:hypothetical protein|uniref:hypothetical protein n=1 Tax=Paraburkholderia sp. TaxID=1926495 RepID=UPI002F4173D4
MFRQDSGRVSGVLASAGEGRGESVAHARSVEGAKKKVPVSARLAQRVRELVVAVVACASLAACASSTDVVASSKPGSYTVAASATGGRMAWARAHQLAMNEARDYCERRGMQSSVTTETVSGVSVMTEHESSVHFECHPKFEAAR